MKMLSKNLKKDHLVTFADIDEYARANFIERDVARVLTHSWLEEQVQGYAEYKIDIDHTKDGAPISELTSELAVHHNDFIHTYPLQGGERIVHHTYFIPSYGDPSSLTDEDFKNISADITDLANNQAVPDYLRPLQLNIIQRDKYYSANPTEDFHIPTTSRPWTTLSINIHDVVSDLKIKVTRAYGLCAILKRSDIIKVTIDVTLKKDADLTSINREFEPESINDVKTSFLSFGTRGEKTANRHSWSDYILTVYERAVDWNTLETGEPRDALIGQGFVIG